MRNRRRFCFMKIAELLSHTEFHYLQTIALKFPFFPAVSAKRLGQCFVFLRDQAGINEDKVIQSDFEF